MDYLSSTVGRLLGLSEIAGCPFVLQAACFRFDVH